MKKAQRDPAQLEQWMQDYSNDILRYAYLYLGDRGLAEDACQQVFLLAYQNADKFRGDSAPRTWLLRIAINVCKNILKSKAYRVVLAECSLDALQAQPESDTPYTLECQDIWQKVLQLSPSYRDVVLLKYYHDYTNEEIGKLLHLSQSTVRSRLSRALGKMRINLKDGRASYGTQIEEQFTSNR